MFNLKYHGLGQEADWLFLADWSDVLEALAEEAEKEVHEAGSDALEAPAYVLGDNGEFLSEYTDEFLWLRKDLVEKAATALERHGRYTWPYTHYTITLEKG